MFGRSPTLPLDILYGSPSQIAYDVNNYKTYLSHHLRHLYTSTQSQLQDLYSKYAQKYISSEPPSFQPDDKVMLYMPTSSTRGCSKFQFRFTGPHTVIRRFHRNVYLIDDDSTHKQQTVNVNRLRPFSPRPTSLSSSPSIPLPAPSQTQSVVPFQARSLSTSTTTTSTPSLVVLPQQSPLSSSSTLATTTSSTNLRRSTRVKTHANSFNPFVSDY
jgi:hypothetical protein